MAKKTKKLNGRPRAFNDEKFEQLEQLMRVYPTLVDTAAFFKCSDRTIENEIKQRTGLTFFEFRERGLVHTRLDIQRQAIKKAKQGDGAMIKYCLRNMSDWRDNEASMVAANVNLSVDKIEGSPALKSVVDKLLDAPKERDVTPVVLDGEDKS